MKIRFLIIMLILAFSSTSYSQIKPPIDKSKSHIRKGLNLFQNGELEKAEKEFLIALKINKRSFIANEMLAQIYYQKKNYQEAFRYAEKAIKINPKISRAYLINGAVLFERGKKEKAKQKFKLALENARTSEEKEKVQKFIAKYQGLKQTQHKSVPIVEQMKTSISSDEPVSQLTSKPYIAVFPFEETNIRTEKTKIGETLSEMLTTALIQTNAFNVMERIQLQKILQEQSLGQTGIIDSDTAIEVGKMLGLEAVIIGSISQLKSVIEGDARMIEVETGKALTAVNSKVANIDDMRNLATQLSKQLAVKAYLVKAKQDTTQQNIIE